MERILQKKKRSSEKKKNERRFIMKSKYHKRQRDSKQNLKFMQTLGNSIYKELSILASKRDITVQEYIRAIALPDHLNSLPNPIKKYSKRAKKAWATRRKNALPKAKEPWEIRPEPLSSDQSP